MAKTYLVLSGTVPQGRLLNLGVIAKITPWIFLFLSQNFEKLQFIMTTRYQNGRCKNDRFRKLPIIVHQNDRSGMLVCNKSNGQ